MWRMQSRLWVVIAALGLIRAVLAQEVLHAWNLDEPDMDAWRCKENCVLEPVAADDGRGLRWRTEFTAFSFGWATRFLNPKLDLRQISAVGLRVKGDGSGHRLHLQLGVTAPGEKSAYYVNQADAITLDFTGWRQVRFQLARFKPPAGRDLEADLGAIAFLQVFLKRQGEGDAAEVQLDDIQLIQASEEEAAMLAENRAALSQDWSAPPPVDGRNLLPNADFELDIDQDSQADFWTVSGARQRLSLDPEVSHSGRRSVCIESRDAGERAGIGFERSIVPGPWVFSVWYRTEGRSAGPERAVQASVRVSDPDGVPLQSMSFSGRPSEGQWQRLEQRFQVLAPAVRIRVTLNQFEGEGRVWWDDVSLEYDVAGAAAAAEAAEAGRIAGEKALARLPALQTAVEALPTGETADKLKQTALAWALEDAAAAVAAGLGTDAMALLDDVAAALDQPRGQRQVPSGELLPTVESFAENPYVQGVIQAAEACTTDTKTYLKGAEGYAQFKSGWNFSSVADRSLVAVWALCQPRSPLAGDPRLLRFALRHLQVLFQSHMDGDLNPYRALSHGYHDANINRFAFRPGLEAYLLLRSVYPDLILPSKRAAWDASVRQILEYQLDTYGHSHPRLEDIRYPNMDVMYMLMMALGARLLEDQVMAKEGRRFLEGLEQCLYPDGAFTYTGYQNECFSYHRINVAVIARYWQISGDDLAREIVARSRPYYPLSVEPGGVPEYYTDPFWKHYWGGPAPAEAPEIVAGITGCPLNKRIANNALSFGAPRGQYAIYAASFWRDFPDEPLPDNYVLYDRNIEGPRGRYGRFSFAATTRDYGWGYQGKDTFAGCMALSEPTVPYPLDAALQVVTNQVRVAVEGQRWRSCRYLSMGEKNAVSMGPDVAGLSTRYGIQNVAWGGRSTLTAWVGNQQWLMTRSRLVGMLEIQPLEDQRAYSIHGRIRFGRGRGRDIEEKEIERRDDRFFRYGALMCRLHEHNYADVITEEAETFYIEKPEEFRSREIVLRDPRSVADGDEPVLHDYPRETRQYFVLEVLPYWSELAGAVRRIVTEEGVRGLELQEGERTLLLLHNPTDTPLRYTGVHPWMQGEVTLHHGRSTPGQAPEQQRCEGGISLTLPAHQHIIVQGGV